MVKGYLTKAKPQYSIHLETTPKGLYESRLDGLSEIQSLFTRI